MSPTTAAITIVQAMRDTSLFARWFRGESWLAWFTFLKALFGLALNEQEAKIFRKYTNRSVLPQDPAHEAWIVAGRRGGKSLIAALVAVFLACFRDYSTVLAPGEAATLMVIASDRRQARVIMRYINGFLDSIPMLAALTTRRLKESIEFSNRVMIEVHVCNFRTVRGYTLAGVICDEIAFWRSDESANPDKEILNGLRPGLATIPGSLLLCISSPYARRGALWEAYRKHYGKDKDPVLVWKADTQSMNPSINPSIIKEAYSEDPASAAAEYGAEFRSDVETFVSVEAVHAVVIPNRRENPPVAHFTYKAFVDPSGGSNDSMTLAIAHNEEMIHFHGEEFLMEFRKDWEKLKVEKERIRSNLNGKIILDCVREIHPPFSPESVVAEFASLMNSYHISTVRGDRYAGEWPREQFRKYGIHYDVSEKSKSELYQTMLPLLMSGRAEILDNKRLVTQLCQLERRTSRGGRDSIDHPPNSHDDLINAVAGALVSSVSNRRTVVQDILIE